MLKKSKKVNEFGSWNPDTWEAHCKQILVFWGMHVDLIANGKPVC